MLALGAINLVNAIGSGLAPNVGGVLTLIEKTSFKSISFPNWSNPVSINVKNSPFGFWVISIFPDPPSLTKYSTLISLPSVGIAPKFPLPKNRSIPLVIPVLII